ncbi:unnamed protein product [Hapterophycus canaliculatus]
MDSDGRCTVVACRDGSLRLLGSLDNGDFVEVGSLLIAAKVATRSCLGLS